MKYRITVHFANDVSFSKECSCVSDAYEAVKAIITDRAVAFPNTKETLSEYLLLLAEMERGDLAETKNAYLEIRNLNKTSRR